MLYIDVSPSCCDNAKDVVLYRNKNAFCGPEQEGWSIIENVYVGTPAFKNINYCPFCGEKLPNEPNFSIFKK